MYCLLCLMLSLNKLVIAATTTSSLGSADSFAILAGDTITNIGQVLLQVTWV